MAKSDIEIAREAKMKPITEVGEKLGIPADALMQFGPTKAKLSYDYLESIKKNKDGKLILVTAISQTPAGEGKTTTTVGPTGRASCRGRVCQSVEITVGAGALKKKR